jgi:hypothetical protein
MTDAAKITQDKGTRQWQARALELAEQRHTTGTALLIGYTAQGSRIYKLPASRSDGSHHIVTYFPASRRFLCGCTGHLWGKPCSHVGAVLYAQQRRKASDRRPQYQAPRLADDRRPVSIWK